MKLVTFTAKPSSVSNHSNAVLSIDIPTPGVLLPVQGSSITHEIVDLSSLGYPSVQAIIEAGPAALEASASSAAMKAAHARVVKALNSARSRYPAPVSSV